MNALPIFTVYFKTKKGNLLIKKFVKTQFKRLKKKDWGQTVKNDFKTSRERTNERPGTDHMILGPMRGLKKTAHNGADIQKDGHGDSMTDLAQWGPFSENNI